MFPPPFLVRVISYRQIADPRHRCRQVDAARRDGLRPSALRHLLAPEERRQAELATPPPENAGLDRDGRLGRDLECCQDLPAFPAVLRQA
jgi:hypothetical protein